MASEPDIGNIPLDKSSGDLDVQIIHQPNGKVQATVRDTLRHRAWSGEAGSESEAATEAVRNFTRSRHARDYLSK
jgi:hypothetical protein